MKNQINTIRDALAVLEAIGENDMYAEEWQKTKQALTALDQLEAAVGEQKPVGAVLVDRESREGVMFYSPDMIPDPATIKDRFELVTVFAAPVAQQPQAEAVPPGYVLAPVDVLKAASESLGSFVSDNGWTDLDMQAMDNLDAILAQQKGGV